MKCIYIEKTTSNATSASTSCSEITRLAKLLSDYQDLPPGRPERERMRNQFYEGFTNRSRKAIASVLTKWKWPSDVREDAKDMAQQCACILLRQEGRSSGIFDGTLKDADLENYIGGTIRHCASQVARTELRKRINRGYTVSLDDQWPDGSLVMEIPVNGVDIPMKIDSADFLERLRRREVRDQKKHAGTTPLAWLLAGCNEMLPKPQVAARTLNRKVADIRRRIQQELDGPSL